MPVYTDQLNNAISLPGIPKRIVSLVPSQSEFLWDLGLREELVGITKFCIHPTELFKTVERVGGTKELDLERIRKLRPDLIIGNKEENSEEQIKLLQREFPVWMSDICTLEDAFQMMEMLGDCLGKPDHSKAIVSEIRQALEPVRNFFSSQKILYLIWCNPYMAAANATFIHFVLNYLGLQNSVAHLTRYPVISAELLVELKPEICLLSSEPFPFKDKHVEDLRRLLPDSKIKLVDGEVFSWYGSRLLKLGQYIQTLDFE